MEPENIDAETLRDSATLACLNAGAIRQCPHHEDVFLAVFDRDASRTAYRLGAAMVANGTVEASEADMAHAIADVLRTAAIECPLCEMDAAISGEPVPATKATYDTNPKSTGIDDDPFKGFPKRPEPIPVTASTGASLAHSVAMTVFRQDPDLGDRKPNIFKSSMG